MSTFTLVHKVLFTFTFTEVVSPDTFNNTAVRSDNIRSGNL